MTDDADLIDVREVARRYGCACLLGFGKLIPDDPKDVGEPEIRGSNGNACNLCIGSLNGSTHN